MGESRGLGIAIFGKRIPRDLQQWSRSLLVLEGSKLPTSTATAALLGGRSNILGLLLLVSAFGCNHDGYVSPQDLAQRILPPPNSENHESLPPPSKAPEGSNDGGAAQTGQTKSGVDTSTQPKSAPLTQGSQIGCDADQPLTLAAAVDLAFRLQPRLRASLESIQQAQGKEDIAFAAFLPNVSTGYSVGGFDLNVGGAGLPLPRLPNSPPFTFVPFTGSLPVGLNIQTGYELAELKLQWLVCDFGRRLGRYNQAGIAIDIAQLQTQRAYQTVANDVATAYYQVLRARSLRRIASESVRRAEDDLDVAKKLAKGGVIEREKVLRAEVALAQAQRALDITDEALAVAVAALNLAIGLNVSAPTDVVDTADVPSFTQSLADCLQAAVTGRREFQVARESVQVAQEGTRVARADFAPRIVADGSLLDFQQSSPRGHADLALGFIKLEWGLFEGGKRVAELRVANSRVREAVAQADSIADTIAFQVNQAYRQLVAARKGIDRSRPAVDQARETYRLVVARSRQGDATPAELTDAQADLTRAEQDYANSVYDYLTAIERLQYAMGITETPLTPGSHP
jgi:outer membrane protein TolC